MILILNRDLDDPVWEKVAWKLTQSHWERLLKMNSIGSTSLRNHNRSIGVIKASEINWKLKDERTNWYAFDHYYVEILRSHIRNGRPFPPCQVIYHPNKGDKGIRLRDGFHRTQAAIKEFGNEVLLPVIIWAKKSK